MWITALEMTCKTIQNLKENNQSSQICTILVEELNINTVRDESIKFRIIN